MDLVFCVLVSFILGFCFCFFFFNDTATTEIYTLSLHDALPIWPGDPRGLARPPARGACRRSEDRRRDAARLADVSDRARHDRRAGRRAAPPLARRAAGGGGGRARARAGASRRDAAPADARRVQHRPARIPALAVGGQRL